MARSQHIFPIVILLLSNVFAQVDFEFDPVCVTASRLQHAMVQDIRNIHTIERKEIESMGASSVPDLLKWASDTQVMRRGNAQSDFSVLGSSYEQVLILIDGIRMNDPQTGHHNSDLPVSVNDIERIEVMPGHGSSAYGADGYGGVIQIITKNPDVSQWHLSVGAGSFQTRSGQLALTQKTGPVFHTVCAEKQVSGGYPLTLERTGNQLLHADYDTELLSYRASLQLAHQRVRCQLGYQNHDFAAYGFYSDWPSREHTQTYWGSGDWQWQPNTETDIQVRFWHKRHNDDFILDEWNPGYYQNHHITKTSGLESSYSRKWTSRTAALAGAELVSDEIESANLGNHFRQRLGLFGEYVVRQGASVVHLGLRGDADSDWGLQVNPDVGLVYSLSSAWQVNASVGRIYRAPTFTDLYYNSPANLGNPDLKPEHGWSYESGFKWRCKWTEVQTMVFLRQEHERIDWIKYQGEEAWQAINAGNGRVMGLSFSQHCHIRNVYRIKMNYMCMRRNEPSVSYRSKYTIMTPEQQCTISQTVQLVKQIGVGIYWKWIDRKNEESVWLLDGRVTIPVEKGQLFFDGNNLLNARYEEIPGVSMPGRALGMGYRLDF